MRKKSVIIVVLLVLIFGIVGFIKMKKNKYEANEISSTEFSNANTNDMIHLKHKTTKPENKVLSNRLYAAITLAGKEVRRVRYMFKEGMVKKSYWNGLYTGTVIVNDEKAVYNFGLAAKGNKIGQVNKTVFEDKPYGNKVKSKCCTLLFYDDRDSISSFSCGKDSNKVTLNFYPDRSLASCGITVDGIHYRARWDENGRLLSETKRQRK